MLIDEDWVSVRVHDNEARWPRCRLVCLLLQLHSLGLELPLQVADVRKRRTLSVAIPAGVEGEDVFLEHPLKEPDGVVAVFQDHQFCEASPANTLKPSFS